MRILFKLLNRRNNNIMEQETHIQPLAADVAVAHASSVLTITNSLASKPGSAVAVAVPPPLPPPLPPRQPSASATKSKSNRSVTENKIQQEVDEIIETGSLANGVEEEYADEPLVPIIISKHSTKTLRWIVGLMEAVFGVGDTSIFPLNNIPSVPFEERKIVLLDYEISDFEQPVTYDNVSTLSKLLNIRVKFRVGWSTEEKTESFIVKVPPEQKPERELADMAKTDRREVFCYSRIFPYLQQWSFEQNIDVVFAIPRCYFARVNRRLDSNPVRGILENIPDAESILVFQDLRPSGFGKRHFVEGLMVEEVKAAICEIAKIHAITYSVQQRTKTHLTQIFGQLHKPLEVALMYDVLLEDAFPNFKKFLIHSQFDTREIIKRIKILETRIRGVLVSLLDPLQPPYPTCLTHMDFWCDNIVFRRRESWENLNGLYGLDEDDTDQAEASTSSFSSRNSAVEGALGSKSILKENITQTHGTSQISDSPLECRILDWQMVSFGRPTHDLALLLMASLQTDIRRKSTIRLLKYYYQVFRNTATIFGAEIFFDFHWLEKEYKRSKLLALLFIVASGDLVMSEPTTQERLIDILAELVADGQI